MGHCLKKSVHLEFFGLPGCGKSTLTRLLASNLRNRELKVKEPSYEIDHLKGIKRLFFKFLIGFKFALLHPQITLKTIRIVKKNGYSLFSPELIKLALNIILKLNVYNTKTSNQIIYVWDQGLIQAAVSVAYEKEKPVLAIWNELTKLITNDSYILPVYLKVRSEIAIQRMNERGVTGARLEREKVQAKKEFLIKSQLTCFATICNAIDNVYVIENNEKITEVKFKDILTQLNL